MKKSTLTFTIIGSIFAVIICAISIFCGCYYGIGVSVADDIDEIFSQSETTIFYPESNYPYTIEEVDSEQVKEIFHKHLDGIKFYRYFSLKIWYGYTNIVECGDYYVISGHSLTFGNKEFRNNEEISTAFDAIVEEIKTLERTPVNYEDYHKKDNA